jgi:hypothetical protein
MADLNFETDTEIDWTAYMEQVEQYVNGERDYTKIKGGTGPLVYPAAHVYVYLGLYYITDKGRNILLAQRIFGVLYLATLGIVMSCYRRAKVCNSAPLEVRDVLANFKKGTSLHLPNAHTIQASPQHLCPPPLQ